MLLPDRNLCVAGEAHAAGVWVSGQSPQGKHGVEGAGAHRAL